MNTIFGIVLFTVGTLGAFVAATAAIAYLKTMSAYLGMRKIYRVAFNVGMITIAVLISLLIAQMLIPGNMVDAIEANVTIAEGFSGLDEETSGKAPSDEIVETDNVKAKESKTVEVENKETDKAEPKETKKADEPESQLEPESQPAPSAEPRSSLALSFSVWSNVYKGKEYAYVEVENGVPYVYTPDARGSFWYDLNNISAGRESGNIVVMANAGVFNDNTSPKGTLVQNGNTILAGSDAKINNTLVIDDVGNVGYTNKAIQNGTVEYTDVLTNKKVSGRRIVSAVTAFSPIVTNGKAAIEYKERVANYSAYRARSIFCVRDKGSYTLITNKGEGVDGGGWNFDDMVTVALRRGCKFAFNLDGGGSTALAWRTSIYNGFSAYATTERYDPTFIVFTADNLAPAGK